MFRLKHLKTKLILISLCTFILFNFYLFSGCKKYELDRVAAVLTEPAENISKTQARLNGEIIDVGSDEEISDFGFCWAPNKIPTLLDNTVGFGRRNYTGSYYSTISGLLSNTQYIVRAYVTEDSHVIYGDTIQFKTESGTQPTGQWLHYDDGFNDDNGIGLTDGGSFDVAIRIPFSTLQQFVGYKISKIRFFARVGSPVEYSVTIWEGNNPPTLVYIEDVLYPSIDDWTEFILPETYYIIANTDLWIGYWIQDQPASLYPAGVDNGPAITGYGDMISMDDGVTWEPLSELNTSLDFNWNLQAYVTNEKGEEVALIKTPDVKRRSSEYLPKGTIVSQIASHRNN